MNKILLGDCLELMKDIPDGSVDMILCDLPYEKTRAKWDKMIHMVPLWDHYKRIIKKNGAIVLTAEQPFSSMLVLAEPKLFRYEWIWEKTSATGALNSKKMPMKSHENVLVFYKHLPTYNPQKTFGHVRKVSSAKNRRDCAKRSNEKDDRLYGKEILESIPDYDSTERFPRSVQVFKSDKQKSALHPTQKPVDLFRYLIRTYTNKGDVVLDNCGGSGTTAIASLEEERGFIVMEKEEKYYDIILDRVAKWHEDQKPKEGQQLSFTGI
jgi:site-specific DNA-methyltransferase (adenine-specific)